MYVARFLATKLEILTMLYTILVWGYFIALCIIFTRPLLVRAVNDMDDFLLFLVPLSSLPYVQLNVEKRCLYLYRLVSAIPPHIPG